MDREQLYAHLDSLRTELELADTLDPQHRAELERLAAEIQEAIDGEHHEHAQVASSQLNDSLVRFEATHPRLTVVVTQIVDMLNRIGI
jgi:hypothetical protein